MHDFDVRRAHASNRYMQTPGKRWQNAKRYSSHGQEVLKSMMPMIFFRDLTSELFVSPLRCWDNLEREQHRYSLKNFAVDAGVRVLFMLTSSGQKQTRVSVVGALHELARCFYLAKFWREESSHSSSSSSQENNRTARTPIQPCSVMGCISLIVLF